MTDIIRRKQVLNSLIKEALWDCEDCPVTFPRKLHFCGGLGKPTFIITIEKMEDEKYFVDEKGRKWFRAD